MSKLIFLDASPLGMVTHPKAKGLNLVCQLWLEAQLIQGSTIFIPEITDYEVRRELIRAGKTNSLKKLDQLIAVLEYVPLTTKMMRLAAELWAKMRQEGQPTADAKALDGDVILAAQAIATAQTSNQDIVIATSNVGHLARLTNAQDWQSI
jgi:predicted nucleic acid-binding protein